MADILILQFSGACAMHEVRFVNDSAPRFSTSPKQHQPPHKY